MDEINIIVGIIEKEFDVNRDIIKISACIKAVKNT